MRQVLLLLALYIGIVMGPPVAVFLAGSGSGNAVMETGKLFALAGFMILALQFLLAARYKWIERPVGLDILIRYHKHMAVFALALLLAHPLLIAAGGGGWQLLIGLDLPWSIWLGKLTLVIVIATVLVSLYLVPRKLKFEKWRIGHDMAAPAMVVFAFTHSWYAGEDLAMPFMKTLWIGALLTTILVFIHHRILRSLRLKRRPYSVTDVTPESEDVWTVTLAPPRGQRVPPFLPGQFHFITFYRGRGLPVEEHHWTISSSPRRRDRVSSTIKALGDFTSTMGETRAGDQAAVHGAFGRFSHVLHPEEKDLVFVAGGIGITPLMSMLRYMRDSGESLSVLLLYANQNEKKILFRRELEDMEKEEAPPRLKVVHVLSRPEVDWTGEKGHVDREKIERYAGGNLEGKVFYVCGPPGMLKAVLAVLAGLGVPDQRIRMEIFSFLD